MSYLVLARKYRPQAFDDVTGQEHVVRTIANAIAQDRVAHAFLLCGPRGVGKTTTARLLARAMNCAKGPTATPCGTCTPCKEIVQGSSVDVVEIDGASNNGVDSVRELRDSARYLPQRDRHKIFIIDEVHMLSVAAFNALLKTLEEPPPHVKFVFATTDPQKLPETILSRCQRHNFRRVTLPKMVERLRKICDEEGVKISQRALELLCRQADGGMRDALSLLDQLLASAGTDIADEAVEEALGLIDRTTVLRLAEALIARDGKALLAKVAEVHDRGIELRRLCDELAQTLRDLLYVKTVGESPGDRSDAERAELAALAARADAAQLARIFDLVHGASREVTHAAQPRLALEVALLTALHLAPAQGLAELAARLETLARGGTPPPSPAGGPGGGGSGGGPGGGTRGRPGTDAGGRGRTTAEAMPAPTRGVAPALLAGASVAKAGRESGGRPSARVTPAPADDEPPPPGDDDMPHELDADAAAPVGRAASFRPGEAPARVFPAENLPGGCATGECGPEASGPSVVAPVASPLPARAARTAGPVAAGAAPAKTPPVDDPGRPTEERWRRALDAVRARSELLALHLAEGRLLWLRPGELAVGFGPSQGFHRAQVSSPARLRELGELLATYFGAPTRVQVLDAADDAPTSVADERRKARGDRVNQLRTEARESEAVRAVQAVLGGVVDDIEVLEDP